MEDTKTGMFKVRAKVANPADPKRYFEEDFWVDTGSMYTLIPEDRLQAIGVEPAITREVILADGRRDRRLLGHGAITLPELGETLICQVLFGTKESLYLIGATAMEAFSVEPDPVSQRLKPIAAIIGAHFDSR